MEIKKSDSKIKDNLKLILKNGPKELSEIIKETRKMNIKDNTIRGILYKCNDKGNEIINIVGTTWILAEHKYELDENIIEELINSNNQLKKIKRNNNITQHRVIQSILIKIGKESGYIAYVPSQDKAYNFNECEKLGDIVDLYNLPDEINEKKKIRTIDVIWFTEKMEIAYLFEVEDKDIKKIESKLDNYLELYNTESKMYIVSNINKVKLEESYKKNEKYSKIINYMRFVEIDQLINFYEKWNKVRNNSCFNIKIE